MYLLTLLIACGTTCDDDAGGEPFSVDEAVDEATVEAAIGRDMPPWELTDSECAALCAAVYGEPIAELEACVFEAIWLDTGNSPDPDELVITCSGTAGEPAETCG